MARTRKLMEKHLCSSIRSEQQHPSHGSINSWPVCNKSKYRREKGAEVLAKEDQRGPQNHPLKGC